jgi:integrase
MPIYHGGHSIPASLSGPIAIEATGLPRYWALTWSVLWGSTLAESHLHAQLSAIDRLYVAVESRTGSDCLDRLLSHLDFDSLEPLLEGYFLELNNQGRDLNHDYTKLWQYTFRFVHTTIDHLSKSESTDRLNRLHARLLRLETIYKQLSPGKKRKESRTRALPAAAVEEIYELIDPTSRRNPFRSEGNAHRNHAIIMLMLHQGLRRGETCILPLDAMKDGFDPITGELRYWLNVSENPYEVDPRFVRPSLKTAQSIRQIPSSEQLAIIVEYYTINYRGKQKHSFMFASQKDKPLSLRQVNNILDVLSASLSPAAKKDLKDQRCVNKISPHDLRHTAAVVRLTELTDAGVGLEEAMGMLKVFFGWSKKSEMPNHYARAYFENRLSTVWNNQFDARVDFLRSLQRIEK